ncbi:C-Jun-amino-terminal kinase-interacting protein 4 [Chelonia mydas]|uniref:C-Jun-amino-terminal kinase-interacting protein 4 n=1 Tax=Chelonia mydas TaxID=8469 RepID=M7BY59_CHEMY|nr:C-Jun-amino-terminal kinase-interacting protein 4 [Chelonia mydas]
MERKGDLLKNVIYVLWNTMIHNYMEHLERTKLHQLTGGDLLESTTHGRIRKERPISLGIFPLPPGDALLTPETQREGGETPGSEHWKFHELSQPRSNTSLKRTPFQTIEYKLMHCCLSKSSDSTSIFAAGRAQLQSEINKPLVNFAAAAKDAVDQVRNTDELSDVSQAGSKSTTPASTAASDVPVLSAETPLKEDNEGLAKSADALNKKSDVSKHIEVQVAQETRTVSIGANENEEKSEVQAIIESTPELDMDKDLSGYKGSSTPTKGIENKAFDRNTESLFEELSSAGSGLIGDVDEGADLLGMGREVENLILENTQLLETKNALNVVKNDLIAKVDELTCEKDVLHGELEAVKQAKQKLEEKNKELEEELRKARAEAEEARQKAKEEDDSDVPTAQRKRFTRVEMARVLMERNQYKERLMELQEAVRWTEMISFSRLFSSSSNTAKKPEPPVNLKYNAPTSHITPSVKKRSSTLSQLPSDKSKAFDFLSEESEANLASRREQKREQYRQVKAHVQKEDGRVQAFGWSLPQKYKQVANGGQGDNKMKNLPVPVYLRPLDEKDTSMKLWCAVGVNLSGGKTRDGGSVVGASVFYNDVAGSDADGNKHRTGSQSSLDRLDQELKEQQKQLKHQEELSSLVWICTSTHSATKVIIVDANKPGNILDNFIVCNSHVLCIASIPGARETDYPVGEEGSQEADSSQVDRTSLCGSMTSNSSAETDSLLGGITVVGCTAEGITGSLITHNANGASSVTDKQPETAAESHVVDENVPTAEEATEATEVSAGSGEDLADPAQTGVYTEHVFTDPLGVQNTTEGSPVYQPSSESDLCKDVVELPNEQDLVREEAQKMSSLLPTMWLGAQNGCLYVHSSVAQWRKCVHAIKLKDSILSIVHVKGIVLVALADGTLAIFHRGVGTGKLGFSFVRITALMVSCNRLWVGTGNGVIISIPLTETNKTTAGSGNRPGSVIRVYGDENSDKVTPGTFIPYCSMAHAQLCFHGHRDAVKFFVAVPGDEGEESELPGEALQLEPSVAKAERSHLIVWQVMYGNE